MRWSVTLAVLILMVGVTVSVNAQEAAKVELKVGDAAPDFKLPGSDGKEYTLSQYKGKQAVVLAFFPKAFTPG
jgi:peroxiredoxin Q/BCP